MKNIISLSFALLLTISLLGQLPEKMSYQAVIRNAENHLVANQVVGLKISILQGSASGIVVFSETHTPTTNANGLISIEIGGGTSVFGFFSTIDWVNGPYFIKTETDPTGGTDYTITGTSQLLSVPYALHAKTAETLTGEITENDPLYSASQAAKITSTDITKLENLSGINTGDQDLSTLATQVALKDSTAQIRSEIPDVSAFLLSETDPLYSASQAANITSGHIAKLNNLSGINTGDQDLSELATKNALADSTASIRNEIPDISAFLTLETDPIYNKSVAKGITQTDTSKWNASYGWGNHSDAGYLTVEADPAFTNHFKILSPENDQLLKYNSLTNRWENFTPTNSSAFSELDPIFESSIAHGITMDDTTNWNEVYRWGNHASAGYLTSYTETDPQWTTASANYYTKTNMQTNGGAQLHFNNISNKPTTLSGYGITDAMSTSHAANGITSTNISNWTTAYGWGNHASAGYLTATQTGNSGKYLTTNGTSPSWVSIDKSSVGLSNVENTALSTWNGTSSISTLGTITTGTWNGNAITSTYIGNLDAAKITSGTFSNARINWATPDAIGTTTAAAGSFTSLSANNGLNISAGTVTIKPSGSGGTNGQVLTTNGSGVATWQNVTPASINIVTKNMNYTISTSDGFILTAGGYTFTLPLASSAGAGKIIYLYSTASPITLAISGSDTFWDADGGSHTTSTTNIYNGTFISDGVNGWYQIAK